jgi:hypothetical protein
VKGLIGIRRRPAKIETKEMGKTGMARERKMLKASLFP